MFFGLFVLVYWIIIIILITIRRKHLCNVLRYSRIVFILVFVGLAVSWIKSRSLKAVHYKKEWTRQVQLIKPSFTHRAHIKPQGGEEAIHNDLTILAFSAKHKWQQIFWHISSSTPIMVLTSLLLTAADCLNKWPWRCAHNCKRQTHSAMLVFTDVHPLSISHSDPSG